MTLAIHDQSRDGLLQITDTNWDYNGTLRVTVRELVGGRDSWPNGLPIAAMRRLARRAIAHPELTRTSRVVNTFYDQGCYSVTFAVSRNER